MGLGPFHTVSLSEAREPARRARKLEGIDLIEARRAERKARRLETAKAVTFKQAAKDYIRSDRSAWRTAKQAAQWEATVAAYAEPVFGALPGGRSPFRSGPSGPGGR